MTFSKSLFAERRKTLMKHYPKAVFVIESGQVAYRNADVAYPFRVESSFFYLTGFEEANACMVLAPGEKAGHCQFILLVEPQKPETTLWEGKRCGIEGALEHFGADQAYSIEEWEQRLPVWLALGETVFYRFGRDRFRNQQFLNLLEKSQSTSKRFHLGWPSLRDPQKPLGEMRLVKSSEEREALRQVGHISAEVHQSMMRLVQPGMTEKQVAAMLDSYLTQKGCERLAYPSIVATGRHATCLHHAPTQQVLHSGELILIDAGGEKNYYASDITRTFPVSGRFNPLQRRLYEGVLKVQKQAIAAVVPGATLQAIHQRVCEGLVEVALSLGLIQGKLEEWMESGRYRCFYPHQTSHWLGLDVHDLAPYARQGESVILEPGMVFTIEPGFYIQAEETHFLEQADSLRGTGIRIEDVVMVTDQGCEVLTQGVPKEGELIEALRNQS